MSWSHYISSFWQYRRQAVNRHGIHSPFVYRFYEEVFRPKAGDELDEEIEAFRRSCALDTTSLASEDPGQGSRISRSRSIATAAKVSSSSPFQCAFLQRLTRFANAEHILELGTNLGIAAAYMSAAHTNTRLWTIEADAELYQHASTILDQRLTEVNRIHGLFSNALPKVLADMQKVDLVFMDGHHDRDATMRYFATISPYLHEDSVVVVDDNHWSPGMQEAWELLKSRQEVSLSIDMYWSGLLFFHRGRQKQHFSLR